MQLNLTRSEFHTRGGAVDQLLTVAFEASFLADATGHIIYCSPGAARIRKQPQSEVIGQPIQTQETVNQFNRVRDSMRAIIGEVTTLNERKCIVNMFPVLDDKEFLGVFCFVLYQNLGHLKAILSSLQQSILPKTHSLYNAIARLESSYTFDDFIGRSTEVREMLTLCRKAAMSPHPILLLGETGTGKELLAHAIHSAQNTAVLAPFVKINCTAIPDTLLESELFGHERGAFTGADTHKPGKFELAAGGTLLLDEIGDMDLRLQGKLLRVLEEREFERVGGNTLIPLNARVIASTNRNLTQLCMENRFRLDLYYRLNTLEVRIPPLRARRMDIPLLMEHFVQENQYRMEFTPGALSRMMEYPWPGNVREIKNLILRLGIVHEHDRIDEQDLTPYLTSAESRSESGRAETASDERQQTEAALRECRYNISKAAQRLSVTRATLYNRIRKHRIKVERSFKG